MEGMDEQGVQRFAKPRPGEPRPESSSLSPSASPPLRGGRTRLVILGDGPSLTREDVELCRDKADILAINYSIQLAPFANIFYYYHEEVFDEMVGGVWVDDLYTRGELKVVSTHPLAHKIHPWPSTPFSGKVGLELDTAKGLRSGGNSGYAAINLAVQLGYTDIILLGFDGRPSGPAFHWFKPADDPSRAKYDFDGWNKNFVDLAPELRALGVSVVNASRETSFTAFERCPLGTALTEETHMGERGLENH